MTNSFAVKTLLALALAFQLGVIPGQAQLATRSERTQVPSDAMLPDWPHPVVQVAPGSLAVRSKDLELIHSPDGFGRFVVQVTGKAMAIGQNHPMIAYVRGGQLQWFDMGTAAEKKLALRREGKALHVTYYCADAHAGHWQVRQDFRPGSLAGTIDIDAEFSVDQDREVACLPLLFIFPGAGTFGTTKGQGLFAGLEYLENEPSSSEADVIGPASKRQIPDNLKLTFPLMAIQNDGGYVALTWQMRPQFGAVFDSPDRLFNSGGHVMGLLFPGSNGENRQEGSLLPRFAERLQARVPLVLRATLLGGRGTNVIAAVQQYCALRPPPAVSADQADLLQYVSLASGAWLDSKIREGSRIRHAILSDGFAPQPAADAAVWMNWLADKAQDSALAGRLQLAASNVLAAVSTSDLCSSGVGHIRYPVASLLYGHVEENAARAALSGERLLAGFEPDGSLKYRPRAGGPDFATTHFTNEANGLTARSVLDLLEAAAFSGDRHLLEASLKNLHAMDKFRSGVPRGAQTWECPLHTPDILASAHLVRAYTLGYELTGDPDFLQQARYWAWTGVPFIYLVNPTDQPVGLYATIPVLGATQWQAPVWLGLPVQWCGLVYADALYRLVRHDPKGPWKKLADGITFSGIRQSWPASESATQGLLPDSFSLREQRRNGPAINPATVEACAASLFGQTSIYDFRCLRRNNLRVHAPGRIDGVQEKTGHVTFQIQPALKARYFILVNGLNRKPQVMLNQEKIECVAPHEFHEKEGRLILQLSGPAAIELNWASD